MLLSLQILVLFLSVFLARFALSTYYRKLVVVPSATYHSAGKFLVNFLQVINSEPAKQRSQKNYRVLAISSKRTCTVVSL